MKTNSSKKPSISETLIEVAHSLRVGVHEHWIIWCLKDMGYSPSKIDTMMRWCKMYNSRKAKLDKFQIFVDKIKNKGEV